MKPFDKNDRTLRRHRAWTGILLLLIGAGMGAGAYRLIATPSGGEALPIPKIGAPNLIKNGGRIEIPDGSPLRDKLTIDAIGQKEIKRNLVLPAVVEADPVVRGQTASSSYKPGRLENGRRVMIPPYIEAGTRIVVNTSDASFVERAKD